MASNYVTPGYVTQGYVEGEAILAQLGKLNAGAWVDLYELDLTHLGGGLLRFHAGTNQISGSVVWQGNTYQPFPIQVDGFEVTGSGEMPRPKLRVANVSGVISALVRQYDDLIGMRLTRKRTMAKYLDAVNFPARRNLLLNSDSLTTGWTRAAPTVFTDGQPGPDGNSTAVLCQGLTSTGGPAGLISRGFAVASGNTYTISVHVNYLAGPGRFAIRYGATADAQTVQFQLRLGMGWQRLQASFLANPAGGTAATCLFGAVGGSVDAALWGAQAEQGAMTDYQMVGASFVQNPTADPDSHLPDEAWFITQKTGENRLAVEFELGSATDLQGVMLPRRQILSAICPWRYRDAATCGYAGGPVADRFDRATTDLAVDNCSHTLSGCKLRFGETAILPFGGFPAVGLTRQ